MEDFDPSKEEPKAEMKKKREEEEEADVVGVGQLFCMFLHQCISYLLVSLHFCSCVHHCSV